jgi:four helix bundle protein
MPSYRSYRDLEVWQVAMQLVVEVYTISQSFPKDERFGLTAQIRRAVVSIVANIAEGHGRGSRLEYRQLASVARGSVTEVSAELDVAEVLQYATAAALGPARGHADSISRMLTTLRRSLSNQRDR